MTAGYRALEAVAFFAALVAVSMLALMVVNVGNEAVFYIGLFAVFIGFYASAGLRTRHARIEARKGDAND